MVQSSAPERKRRERVNQFLLGLDDDFSVIIGQILSLEVTPPLSKVLFLITQEENHKKRMKASSSQENITSALVVNRKPFKNIAKKEKEPKKIL